MFSVKKTWIGRFIGVVVTAVLGVIGNYLFLPAWNVRSAEMWFFILGTLVLGAAIQLGIEYFMDEEEIYGTITFGAGTALVAVFLIIGGLTGAHMFNASKYQKIAEIQNGNFSKDISEIKDFENISIVDMETAKKVGDKTVGSINNAAWYEVNEEYDLIKYKDGKYRISPLEYGGYFKAQKAKKNGGIPGYVLVNVKDQKAEYVKLNEGIKYAPSAYWSYDLGRHLRAQYPSYIFGKSFFEIDEEGNPYYITAVETPTIGLFGGKTEEKFVITNAVNGESKEYEADQIPNWIDHAYDLDYLMRITENNLEYVNGYFNSLFAKTNVYKTTYSYNLGKDTDGDGSIDTFFEGYNTAITAEGDIVFYTGLTPASKAESNVGFILANPRTGVIKRYECSGAEESAASASAESLVQDLKYVATFPTILNVDGNETYFMLLKDKEGLVQRYALCNVKDYYKVVQANSLDEALKLYREKLGIETTEGKEQDTEVRMMQAEGIIEELYQAELDGTTYYYFSLEHGDGSLYVSSIKNNSNQVRLKVGTKVSLKYLMTDEEGIMLVKNIQF